MLTMRPRPIERIQNALGLAHGLFGALQSRVGQLQRLRGLLARLMGRAAGGNRFSKAREGGWIGERIALRAQRFEACHARPRPLFGFLGVPQLGAQSVMFRPGLGKPPGWFAGFRRDQFAQFALNPIADLARRGPARHCLYLPPDGRMQRRGGRSFRFRFTERGHLRDPQKREAAKVAALALAHADQLVKARFGLLAAGGDAIAGKIDQSGRFAGEELLADAPDALLGGKVHLDQRRAA